MSDLILTRHVAAALLAIWESKRSTVELFTDGREGAFYLAGVRETISAVAITFGISPGMVLPEIEEAKRE